MKGASVRRQNLKWAGVVVILVLVLGCVRMAAAQQPTKIPRIAFLGTASASVVATRVEAFREGLRELGYVEGKNIVMEYRFGEGKSNQSTTTLAVELARSKVDVIVTAGSAGTRSAKEATVTIPIVMGNEGDPVSVGFCCEPCSTWRKHYWNVKFVPGDQRQTTGDSKGHRS